MTNWMLRGLVFAGAMVVVRLFQGALINAFQTQAALISIVLLLLFIAAAMVWGNFDGRADAAANPDPDRRGDLAMVWLVTGVVAGILSGFVVWLITLFYKGIYAGGLINEVTTFASFTALVVFVSGIAGVTFGRWRIDRTGAYAPRSGRDEERVDTDVFAAVGGGNAAAQGVEQPTATQPAYSESPTEEIKLDEAQQPKPEEQ
ncbi:B-4DMT family transporter [Mycobacterium shimoidei]|uniref:B-4DMT family transporter n=1 Tax=Mycobacterium shimoidei TaxID=29313 RepID=UPI000848C43B|nr:B-4DMT family transporter [Mycobacterium shimoidei]MCV7258166.1 B-4DMT family transporter [Mycobacterium shimoidei]ODR12125.1 hypothetical protein BHQ16_17190 [Mycobacterium shimoidei]ORW82280.1 hypothetical protein AWC26_04925 [Mycobacterium shimoidei]